MVGMRCNMLIVAIALVASLQVSSGLNLRVAEAAQKSYGVADAILSKFRESSRSLVEQAVEGKKPMAMMPPGADAAKANADIMSATEHKKPEDPIGEAEEALKVIAAPASEAAAPAAEASPVAPASPPQPDAAQSAPQMQAGMGMQRPIGMGMGMGMPPMGMQRPMGYPGMGMPPMGYPGMGMPPMGMGMPRMPMPGMQMPRQQQMPEPKQAEEAPEGKATEDKDSSADSEFDSAISALEGIIHSTDESAMPAAETAPAHHHHVRHHHHPHHGTPAAPVMPSADAVAPAMPGMDAAPAPSMPAAAPAMPGMDAAAAPAMPGMDATAAPAMPGMDAAAPASPAVDAAAPASPGMDASSAPAEGDDDKEIKVNPYGIEPEYAAAIAQAHAQEQLQVQESVVASQMKRQHDLAVKKAENDERVVDMLVNLTKRWESQANASQTMAEKAEELMMQITGAQVARAKLEAAAQEEINAKRAHEINKATMKHHQEVLWALGNATEKSEDRAKDASKALGKAFDLFKENSNRTGAAALAREGVDFAKLGLGKAMPAIPGAVPALQPAMEAAATAKLTAPPTAIALGKPDPAALGGPVDPQEALKAVTKTIADAQAANGF